MRQSEVSEHLLLFYCCCMATYACTANSIYRWQSSTPAIQPATTATTVAHTHTHTHQYKQVSGMCATLHITVTAVMADKNNNKA